MKKISHGSVDLERQFAITMFDMLEQMNVSNKVAMNIAVEFAIRVASRMSLDQDYGSLGHFDAAEATRESIKSMAYLLMVMSKNATRK